MTHRNSFHLYFGAISLIFATNCQICVSALDLKTLKYLSLLNQHPILNKYFFSFYCFKTFKVDLIGLSGKVGLCRTCQ